MSRDKIHGSNRNAGSGYLSDVGKILGHPDGFRPVSNGVATVQKDTYSDDFPGDEANSQNVNWHGEPKGSCHLTQLSTLADLTAVLQIHYFVRQNINLYQIDIKEKENQLLLVSYPRSKFDYDTASPWDVKAIQILTTGLSPCRDK